MSLVDEGDRFERAMDRAQGGDLDGAAELFRQASDRGHSLAAYLLGALLKERGQLADAEVHYRRALAVGLPEDTTQAISDCEASLGWLCAQRGDDVEAERLYRSADARGFLDATFDLGNLLSRTGRVGEAEQVWRRAAAAGQPDAAYNLAELLVGRDELEEAERLWRQAIAGGIADAVNNLAMVCFRRGDQVEAEALWRQAVAAGDVNAMFNVGIALNAAGRLEEAEAMLGQAAAAGHPDAAAHLDRLVLARHARRRSSTSPLPYGTGASPKSRSDCCGERRPRAIRKQAPSWLVYNAGLDPAPLYGSRAALDRARAAGRSRQAEAELQRRRRSEHRTKRG